MMRTDPRQKPPLEQEFDINRKIAFASGLFHGDVTGTLLESFAEGIVVIDSSGTILLVNTRGEEMFGYPNKELLGKPHAILIPERFRKVHEEHEAHFFAEPKIRPMGELLDLVGLRRDGSEFPLEISLSFLETISGILVIALVSDITLKNEIESAKKLLANGVPPRDVAKNLGVSVPTLYRWIPASSYP
jgi:PAS domain S-box-containing protein